jgi:hypothetical protein
VQVGVTIASFASLGAHNVIVTTAGGTATCTGCLSIDRAPRPRAVSPRPPHGNTTTVTVTGSDFKTGLSVNTTITGATLGPPTNITATSFQIAITVPAADSPGDYKLIVINRDHGRGSTSVTVT